MSECSGARLQVKPHHRIVTSEEKLHRRLGQSFAAISEHGERDVGRVHERFFRVVSNVLVFARWLAFYCSLCVSYMSSGGAAAAGQNKREKERESEEGCFHTSGDVSIGLQSQHSIYERAEKVQLEGEIDVPRHYYRFIILPISKANRERPVGSCYTALVSVYTHFHDDSQ